MTVEVHDLEWDEAGEEHVAKHGLTVREVNQIVAVALEKTREAGTWRVATAYPATDAQQQVIKREVR